jgi:hypothetical protein
MEASCPFCGVQILPSLNATDFIIHPPTIAPCPLGSYSFLWDHWKQRPSSKSTTSTSEQHTQDLRKILFHNLGIKDLL